MPEKSESQNKKREQIQSPWALPAEEAAKHFDLDPEQGLSAEQVRRQRHVYGPNRLRQKQKVTIWKLLVNQFKSLVIILLGVASAAAFLFGEWLESVAVAIALVLNAAIGFITELKATRSMEALQRLERVSARVQRDGQDSEISAAKLVPGDVVQIDAGDLVPADLRLFEANRLRADESALTGESVPAPKTTAPLDRSTPLAERANMLFKGTAVTSGSGAGIVTATGMNTEIGTIAGLVQEAEDEMTPLEKRLERLGRRLVLLTLVMGIVVAAAGLIGGRDVALVLETAIAMAIAAVPEGLPVVATIALARGMWRMAEHNALISRLSAVETLGATTVIFTDKTGTLTENRMRVRRFILSGKEIEIDEEEGPDPKQDARLQKILRVGVLCNNASLNQEEELGDPTETALLRVAGAAGVHRQELLKDYSEIREEAFSAETMMMATFHEYEGEILVAVKGAPEAVLGCCTRVAEEDEVVELSQQGRREWVEQNRALAEEGMRLMALAAKEIDSKDEDPYGDLTLLGFAALHDPPRQDVADALKECASAGIRVIMVTGDHPATARGIAAAVGLEADASKTLKGEILQDTESLSPEEQEKIVQASIFARVTPEQKLSLISLYRDKGEIVAMTGDGVNDAPALKKADIGVAMGKRGTQVAKEAADMVLKDDRFGTIVLAIRYGRGIFNNIRNFITYLISGNVSEVAIITLATLVGAPLPLLPLQILYINLIGDVFPALALGMGEARPRIMQQPPRDPKEPVLTRKHWLGIGGYTLIFTIAVLGAFAVALVHWEIPAERAVTISFSSLVLARLWHVFNMRDPASPVLRNEITTNPHIWGAIGLGIGLLLSAIYLPGLSKILGLVAPSPREWLLILGASLIPLAVGQAVKLRIRFHK
ncbi:cation-transporting P-type ATPase [Desulfuromonas sp. AOP6]|uniref:cation-translocating P-type ATPase n=1 Tax=Desulfuromonas sp. AOP6 TaxID=1566351 RepID=UPI0012887BAE|nr:cation-transporting P-type ATPase [Desulfuromonas sp. AOP6]BCA79305.1 calcium-transporting P-type ATPase, PMR1-type [Desulfuromonas sp. AOP6]